MNPDKRLVRPTPPQDGPHVEGADGGPGAPTGGARRWPPRQRVFTLRPPYPLGWPVIDPSGPF